MKKLAIAIVALMLLAMAIPAFADDAFTLDGTAKTITIDGVLDDGYTFLHDFYGVDNFADDNDPDHVVKGSAYATWDKNNFYVMLKVFSDEFDGDSEDDAHNMGIGCVGYVSCIATDGDYDDDTQRFEIGITLSEEGTQAWKISGAAPIKDAMDTQEVFETAPYQHYVVRDDANKVTWYEFGIPWSFMDRSGTLTYDTGSKFIFNYAANIHTRDMYNDGEKLIVEYGGGCWAGSYTDGGVVTLGVIVEDEPEPEPEPETEAPAPAPAAEAAPAPAAEAAPAPVAETAAPVVAAAPAAAAPAAQTGDVAAIAILAAVAALGTAVVVSKKH